LQALASEPEVSLYGMESSEREAQIIQRRSGPRASARPMSDKTESNATPSRRELIQFVTRQACCVCCRQRYAILGESVYVTHSGLRRIAQRRRCLESAAICKSDSPIRVAGRWVFRATVYKSGGSRRFGGYGDADPMNVSPGSVAPTCALPRPPRCTLIWFATRKTERVAGVLFSDVSQFRFEASPERDT
jgi:hypothetical protein